MWLSSPSDPTPQGSAWQLLAGSTGALSSNNTAPPLAPYATFSMDPITQTLYAYGGVHSPTSSPFNQSLSTDLYLSTDLTTWSPVTSPGPSPAPRIFHSLVVTSTSRLLLLNGANPIDLVQLSPSLNASIAPDPSDPSQRVWEGVTQASPAGIPAYGPRLYEAVAIDHRRLGPRDVIYVVGGIDLEGEPGANDVWVSSDEGVSWATLGDAPFSPRFGHSLAITPNGILVVVGGLQYINGTTYRAFPSLSDVWASMDGGWTWGRCATSTPLGPRDHAALLISPSTGRLVAGLGFTTAVVDAMNNTRTQVRNDLWQSSIDFTDPYAVQATCGGLVYPGAGVGLTRWPGAVDSSTGTARPAPPPVVTSTTVTPPPYSTGAGTGGGGGGGAVARRRR